MATRNNPVLMGRQKASPRVRLQGTDVVKIYVLTVGRKRS